MKYQSALVPKLIYVFRINDRVHKGCLKIGDAKVVGECSLKELNTPNSKILNQAARKRINSYTQTAGIAYDLLYTELAVYPKGKGFTSFRDYDVHDVLKRSGIRKKVFDQVAQADEWYITDLETAKKAIAAVKNGRTSLLASEITTDQSPIVFRPEQQDAIQKTIKQFKKNNQMLWYAKMRFGKTLSALQVVKEIGFARTLILTHRPVVNDSWFEDFKKIFYDRDDFVYGSRDKSESFAGLKKLAAKKSIHYVYFASMQDLRGSERTGGKFDKNDEIFDTDWDLIIVDEAHEGTQTELGRNVLTELTKDETKILHLSGTPFNLLDDYKEDEIYTWDYVMEQKAKAEWDILHRGDPNPYAELPRLNIFTFDLGDKFSEFKDSELAFNFHEFFRVDEDGEFVHRKSVKAFLDLISQPDNNTNYPFSTQEYRDNFRHSFWRIPGVKEGKALSAMLKKHSVFGQFQVVNVAGEGDDDEKSEEALGMVRDAISKYDYTITLSCGRLTTGVTVPEWTAVFMLAGSFNTSASSYMQTIFRAQTPARINGKFKEECFVFDFAPDRTLKVIAETAKMSIKVNHGNNQERDRKAMGEFLNFCPVISIDGTRMKDYDVDHMLEQLKKVYIERVVRNGFEDAYLYNNDMLMKLDENALAEFKELKGIIRTTKAMPKTGDIDINNQGFTDEEYEEVEEAEKRSRQKKELTKAQQKLLEEKKEKKKNRDNAISILRGISIRMPLMIYGAELKDESQEITIDNFATLIDLDSWTEYMPVGVTKQLFNSFKKYYDPDIFRAAGKRIRMLAKAADDMTIEERIERITGIFNTFRNPDKETVLTPWRAVNIHLSETVGGYCFFDEHFESPLPKPRLVKQGKTTDAVFDSDSRILEINSKTGLYPLYVAYSIYRTRLKEELIKPNLESAQKIWDQVLAENLFIICKTPMAKSITKRTLCGFRKGRVNAHYFKDLINMLKNKPQQFVDRITRESFWGLRGNSKMKFNAIVGNPPYQEETAKQESATNGQAPRTSIFQYFQIAADNISSGVTSLIYPGARWIHRSGKGMSQFGLQQINDVKLKQIDFYPDSSEIFKDVAIADGLSIVMKDNTKNTGGFTYVYHKNGNATSVFVDNPGEDLIPLNPRNNLIISKVSNFVTQNKLNWLHSRILPRTLFGIESNFVEEHPQMVREISEGMEIDFSREIKLFTNDKAGKAGRARWFVAKKNVIPPDKQKFLTEWQVVVSSANAGGQKRDNQISIMDNHSAFGRARVALGSFKTKQEAINFYKYAQSAIIRFMFLMTDESLTSFAKKVPDIIDYSSKNKFIDFSEDINSQLCQLIGLTDDEVNYIESQIRPMA